MTLAGSPLEEVERINRDPPMLREREILAPVLPSGRIRARLDGIVQEFRVREPFVGWGIFRPTSEREAVLVAPALPGQRAIYLDQLPALRVMLLWPDSERHRVGLWLALPLDAGDVEQSFRISGAEPVPVVLADPERGADQFERVIARVAGTTIFYDNLDPRADPVRATRLRDAATRLDVSERSLLDLAELERQALLYARIRALDLDDAEARSLAHVAGSSHDRERLVRRGERRGLEDRLRLALSHAGAVLRRYVEIPTLDGSPGRLIVEWSRAGRTQRYRSTIEPRGDVVSIGICLTG
jgi:hypothetical protein